MKIFLHFILPFLFPLLVAAQHEERMGPPPPMERLESFKKVRMLEELKLDEQTGIKLVSKYSAHRKAVRALEGSRFELIEKLQAMLNAGASDADFQNIYNQLGDVEKSITDTRIKFISDLKEILTTKQIAEYLVFEMNFAKDIRNILRDGQKRERSR
jgi:hypothetical protein